MKKLITLALCLGAIGSMSAQKANVDAANKLAGKPDKLEEARGLIQQAMANPETANDARTYYVGGKLEMDTFDKLAGLLMIDPNAAIDGVVMGEQLLNAYNYWVKAMDLDQLPNEKGQVKPKFTKDIQGKLVGHIQDYARVGADLYNAKKYYPEAYTAFMITGNMPQYGAQMNDSTVSQYYSYAGISAYLANEFKAAADAFKKSRLAGAQDIETYVNELSCWQQIRDKDLAPKEETSKEIWDAAKHGYDKFGVQNAIFLINMVNELFTTDRKDEAIALCEEAIAADPTSGDAYGILGNTYTRNGNVDKALENYKIAITKDNVSPQLLLDAATFFYRAGTAANNLIEGNSPEAKAQRKAVIDNYVTPGYEAIRILKVKDPKNYGILEAEENIDYLNTLASGGQIN